MRRPVKSAGRLNRLPNGDLLVRLPTGTAQIHAHVHVILRKGTEAHARVLAEVPPGQIQDLPDVPGDRQRQVMPDDWSFEKHFAMLEAAGYWAPAGGGAHGNRERELHWRPFESYLARKRRSG